MTKKPEKARGLVGEAGQTRLAFLDAARRNFAERGFYGASIAQIADDLGLTKQALLHHFGSKEKLYGEVLADISARLTQTLDGVPVNLKDPESRLAGFLDRFAAYIEGDEIDAQLLMRELLDNKRRAETAENWYLKPFLESLTALAGRTSRWQGQPDAEVFAGVYQLLGAVTYFAVSRPTLSKMFGASAYAEIRRSFPGELQRLTRDLLDVGDEDIRSK